MTVFFERLGLAPSADTRAIRQAYARELKLIKHDNDVHAFQSLREAYEAALRWCEGVPAKAEPVPPLVLHARQFQTPDINELTQTLQDMMATQVLDELRMCDIVQALQPESLAASESFEIAIAALLDQGWRPGHEYLFSAACKVFQWDEGRLPAYLEEFSLLAGAIQDLKYLRSQPEAERGLHLRIIHDLRQEQLPPLADLGRHIVVAGQVNNFYPDLLALASAPHRLQTWREGMSAALERTRREARARPVENRPLSMREKAVVMIFVALGTLIPLAKWVGDGDIPGAPPSSIPYLGSQHYESVSRYVGPSSFKEPVIFEVSLLREGGIAELKLITKKSSSDDERKVANAIRWAAPYPDDCPRTFRIRFPS